MENQETKPIELSESAFRELKPDEKYEPVMSPDKNYPEVNAWSVTWGVLMAVLFSAAAAYLGLKVGQVFEAAIPIAIIAIGLSSAAKRKNGLGENVIIQSIGACSGAIVAGGIFVMPAIYMLDLHADFLRIFIAAALGGVLGILFLIPFRKYFVKDMHGKYPFPEATATTQVLVSGEKGGSQAKPLLLAGIIGGLYDFTVATFGWWNEQVTSRAVAFGETLAEKAKLVVKLNTGAAVLGLGYIIGLRYAFIICMGSICVWWIIVPAMAIIFPDTVLNQWDPTITTAVGDMTPEQIFTSYARSIGIGGIAMAGIIGIVKSWGIIKGAVGLAAREMKGKGAADKDVIRTQRDISFKIIAVGSVLTLIITFLFFYFGVMNFNLLHAVVVAVEDALRTLQVKAVLGIYAPRQRDERLQVVEQDTVVGRLGIDIVELGELLGKELAHLIGPGLEEGLLLELPLVLRLAAVAQLLADVLDLLVEEVLLLLLVDVGARLVLDVLLDVQELGFAVEDLQQLEQSQLHVVLLQQHDLVVNVADDVGGDEIDDGEVVADVLQGDHRLVGDVVVHLHIDLDALA